MASLMTKISEAVQSPSERSKFAYKVMLAFSFLYYLRPSDVIPGLRTIPLAKITGAIAIQAFFNISVVLGLLPTKGIPLPFISDIDGSVLILAGQ